jgi:hypothetical protein
MTKISALSDIGTSVASNDAFVLVDVSDPTTPNKKIQQQNLLAAGGLLPDGSAGTPGLRFTSDTNVGLFRPTTDTLGFATGGSERLRIDSSGRVGIGTSSPINTLHVNGTGGGSFTSGFADALALINATTNTAGQGAALALTALATKETAWIISAEHTSGNNGDLAFYGYPGGASYAERMRITSAGNVGIGTTSPDASDWNANSQVLHIYKNTTEGSILKVESSNAVGVFAAGNGLVAVGSTSNDPLQFRVNVNEVGQFDTSGRLLVGTASTSTNLRALIQATSANSAGGGNLYLARGESTPADGASLGYLGFSDSNHNSAAGLEAVRDGGTWTSGSSQPSRLVFSTTADGAASPTQRLVIKNNGLFGFFNGTPTFGFSDTAGFQVNPSGAILTNVESERCAFFNRQTTDGNIIDFARSATTVGSISVTTTATAYNTSSDYRLKENVTPVSDGITRLQQLKPARFNFIADPDKTVDGFLAHEVQTIVPEAITGEKDAVDDDGNPKYQGIDQSKLVPLLTAALQEAVAKIESLEARLTAAGL